MSYEGKRASHFAIESQHLYPYTQFSTYRFYVLQSSNTKFVAIDCLRENDKNLFIFNKNIQQLLAAANAMVINFVCITIIFAIVEHGTVWFV
jgi:hypothetical protein